MESTYPESPGYFRGAESNEMIDEIKKVLSPYFIERRFKAGELLWSEGDTTGMMVSILSGSVKIYRLLPDGRIVTLYIFHKGTLFGFMPFIDGLPYPAYAQAMVDTETVMITRAAFSEIIKKDPDVCVLMMKILSRRLRQALFKIEQVSGKSALPRVAAALSSLMEERDASSSLIELRVSAHEFAGLIGITPESFSRGITHLLNEGIIKRAGVNRYSIEDRERLNEIALKVLF